MHKLVFNLLLAAMCLYALRKGGQPEKLAALGWAVGCAATYMLPFDPGDTFWHVDMARVAVDLAVLTWFVALAAIANRFWPMWLAAVHLLAVAAHGAKVYQPDLLPSVYALAVGKVAYPMLMVLVVGIARHQARLRRFGAYRDWSFPGAPA